MKARKKYIKPGAERQLELAAGGRGLERAEFFANGGTAIEWKGGPAHVHRNKKSETNRKACRGKKNTD